MPHLTTYHLFHRQADPLPPGAVDDHAWLINNACSYNVVAVIEAPGAGEALQAAQCKAQARTLPRSTLIRAGNLLRETLPGDVLVSKNEAWIVDASQQIRKVSYKTNQNRKSFRQRSTINDLAWSPNGLILAIAENDRRVVLRIPENTNEYPPAYSRGEYAAAERLAWSPDGTRLASAGSRSEVHIWQPALWRSNGYTGSILICGTEEVVASYARIYRLVWTPDGSRIMAGREDGCLISWNASTGSGYRLQKRHAKAITALAFSPREEHLLLTASADTTVQIWDEVAEQEQVRFEHTASVTTAVWSPDGKVVASCEREDPTISLWSSQTGHLVARIPLSMYTIHDLTVYALA